MGRRSNPQAKLSGESLLIFSNGVTVDNPQNDRTTTCFRYGELR